MNIIPIVFSFDDNLVLPAGIAIHSLLKNSKKDTFYQIYILHDNSANFPSTNIFQKLEKEYSNYKLSYINVGDEFKNAYEIRGITAPTYYRLLIPDLLPQYDKIMYHDVDVIFQDDLSEIFNNCIMDDYYVGGVVSPACLNPDVYKKRINLGLDPFKYVIAGNLVLNSALLRSDKLVEKFKLEAKKNHEYQDQDVINIVCKGRVKHLPVTFGASIEAFRIYAHQIKQNIYEAADLDLMQNYGIIHYNGPKPWKTWCPNMDIWWEYYRSSVYYNPKIYFDFYKHRLEEYDRMSLIKRLKILARYFVFGKKKN